MLRSRGGLYVTDDYKVTPSMTLEFGSSWDYSVTKTTITSMAWRLGILATKGSSFDRQKQLRLASASPYDPFRTGKFVIRRRLRHYYENLNFLTTRLEKGFDGRKIGVHSHRQSGGITSNDPLSW